MTFVAPLVTSGHLRDRRRPKVSWLRGCLRPGRGSCARDGDRHVDQALPARWRAGWCAVCWSRTNGLQRASPTEQIWSGCSFEDRGTHRVVLRRRTGSCGQSATHHWLLRCTAPQAGPLSDGRVLHRAVSWRPLLLYRRRSWYAVRHLAAQRAGCGRLLVNWPVRAGNAVGHRELCRVHLRGRCRIVKVGVEGWHGGLHRAAEASVRTSVIQTAVLTFELRRGQTVYFFSHVATSSSPLEGTGDDAAGSRR